MKKIIPVIIIVSSFIVHANAQLIKTPDLVKQAFDKQYPMAKLVDWKGGLDNHTVLFVVNEKKYKASYTS